MYTYSTISIIPRPIKIKAIRIAKTSALSNHHKITVTNNLSEKY